jgi:flagellar protein FlgJ
MSIIPSAIRQPDAIKTPTKGGDVARPSALTPEKDAKLLKAAQQMEGTFVQQMFKAMRETVPDAGAFNGGSGEEMFTGMLDERIAADTPGKWHHGLSEAIYRQMRNAVLIQAHEEPVPSKVAPK